MFLNGGAFIATIAKNWFIELGAVEYKVFLYVVGLLSGTWHSAARRRTRPKRSSHVRARGSDAAKRFE